MDGPSTASPTPVATGRSPSGLPAVLARVRTVVRRAGPAFARSPWVWVLAAAIGPFLWARPYGDVLFGQDSIRTVQPFAYNGSPYVPYSYLYSSTFPVPDNTASVYLDATLRAALDLGAAPWLAERVLLAVFAGVAAAGVVVLLRAIERANDRPVAVAGWAVGAAALVYVYNPFTATVTFWHLEGWASFLAFLPWLTALGVRVAFEPRPPWRFAAVTTMLGVYFAPGVDSAYAVPLALVLLAALVALWLRPLAPWTELRRRLTGTAALLAVGIGIVAWNFLPLLLVPNLSYTSNNYVTPTNILTVYRAASLYWSPYAVLTLTAFSWPHATPSAYGWIAWFPLVAAVAFVYPLLVVLGAERLRSSRGALLVTAVGLVSVPLMIGAATEPLASWNVRLIRAGGPFLVLVAAFYVLAPLFLLASVVAFYEILRPRAVLPARPPPDWRAGVSRAIRRLQRPSSVVVVALAVLLVLGGLPFVVAAPYQTQGPNADALALPSSFSALARYFGSPSSGPSTWVLVAPMSAQEGAYVDIDGSQFLDTSNLLASYIPYPVLEANTGPMAGAVEEDLSLGVPVNVTAFLDTLHVGAVVVNPYANASAPAMNEAPNGAPIDWGAFFHGLSAQLGPGTPVGPFVVYRVPNVTAIGWSSTALTSIVAPGSTAALELVGAVARAPPAWGASLREAIWTPNASLPGWQLRPEPVAGPQATVPFAPGSNASEVTQNGTWESLPCETGSCTANGTEYRWTATNLTVEGPVESATSTPGAWSTSAPAGPSGYCGPGTTGPSLTTRSEVTAPSFVESGGAFASLAANNWINVEVRSGTLGLLAQVYQPGTSGPAALGLSALNGSRTYAWHNVYLPTPIAAEETYHLTLEWNATSAYATVAVGSGTTASALAFGNASLDRQNIGHNASATPPGTTPLGAGYVTTSIVGAPGCIASAAVVRAPAARLLVASTGNPPGPAPEVGPDGSVASDGDVAVPLAQGGPAGSVVYAVLAYPPISVWRASVTGGGTGRALGGAPFAMVVAVDGAGPSTVVTFHFQTDFLLGLDGSLVELGGLAVAVVAFTVLPGSLRRRGRPPTRSPSTPVRPPGERPIPPRP